jgi:hypothetical protein
MPDPQPTLDQADSALLVRFVMDAFHRIVVHYGQWMAEVAHQLGPDEALALEHEVWEASLGNQLKRLGQTLGFAVEDGVPAALARLPRERLQDLVKALGINWLANDGIWFQAVERRAGMVDAKRCNDTCWVRFSPFEALRIKRLLGLPDNGGLTALKAAIAFRLYATINVQSFEDLDDRSFVFRMNDCRVQAARKRKGLPDYPCQSAGMVEYPYFARAVDSRIRTTCVACPPDPHPEEWYCAWKFSLPAD